MNEVFDKTLTDFDSDIYCPDCFARGELVKWVNLPNGTRTQDLPVRVCPHCDSKELVELATRPERI